MIDPRAFNLPDRAILSCENMDALGLALIALTREVWIVRHRQAVLEAVLSEAGIDATARIETIVLDDATASRLDREGQRLVDGIVGALGGMNKVEQDAS